MSNQKKIIGIINKFLSIPSQIKLYLKEANCDYFLDASGYLNTTTLLKETNPDKLYLYVNLGNKALFEIVTAEMQNCGSTRISIITTSPYAYYMSLCSSF